MSNSVKKCESDKQIFTYDDCSRCTVGSCDIKDIISLIDSAGKKSDGCGRDRTWTVHLNTKFIQFSKEKQLNVFCKTEGADGKEWLYDITICYLDENRIDKTYLVAESEWKKDDYNILYDFEKLLLCNSLYKVMIFSKRNKEIRDEMFEFMKKRIITYSKCNGVFILAGFVNHIGYTFKIIYCDSQS